MASPVKISHQVPRSLFLCTSFPSTNPTVITNAPLKHEKVSPGAVCLAAASDPGPAEPAKGKPKVLPKKPVYSSKKLSFFFFFLL